MCNHLGHLAMAKEYSMALEALSRIRFIHWSRHLRWVVRVYLGSGVEGGCITDVNDVFQAVKYHFENGENCVRTRAGSNPISHYKFFSHLMADTPGRCPTEDKVFNSLEGISSNYQFVVHDCGLVYQQKRSCWCIWCMSKIQSTLCWAETYAIPNCLSHG